MVGTFQLSQNFRSSSYGQNSQPSTRACLQAGQGNPTHIPPATVVRTEPFIKPADQPSQHIDQPTSADLSGTDPPAATQQSTSKSHSDRPQKTNRPRAAEPTGNDPPVLQRHSTSKSAFKLTRRDSFSSESDSDSILPYHPPVDIYVEEGELSDDQDVTITDPDQSLSEEQTCRETMRGIRSHMGWTHIPDIDSI